MYGELLTSLGLSPTEARIYEALLHLKSASIGDISSHADVHRRNVYDAVQRLLKKGLVFQILPKKNLTYSPVHPDKLRELLHQRASQLESALPGLAKAFSGHAARQAVYVYQGVGGLKNFIELMLKEGKTVYGVGSKGVWFDPRVESFVLQASKRYRSKRMKSYLIYDDDMRSRHDVLEILGKPYKFLPKKYSGKSSVAIFGDYVGVFSGMTAKRFENDITIFILRDKTLADDYRKWWRFMWDNLPEG